MTLAKTADEEHAHCFICTNDITIYAFGPCNHKICHICAVRMRALYKNNNCAYCKVRSASFAAFESKIKPIFVVRDDGYDLDEADGFDVPGLHAEPDTVP
jgi:hypothetical protein